MRLWTVEIVCRLGEDGSPDLSVSVDVEPGAEVIAATIPGAVQSVGRQLDADFGDLVDQARETGEARVVHPGGSSE